MPNSKHLTHGISNLVSLITKTKLGLSSVIWGIENGTQGHTRNFEIFRVIQGITELHRPYK
jgi:hypothetical protein